MCRRCQKEPNGYWLKNNLQPVWYERTKDVNIRLDDVGEKVVRYDTPKVLSTLNMSEKLLIRCSTPFIPSIHILNGIYEVIVCPFLKIEVICATNSRDGGNQWSRLSVKWATRIRLKCI